MKKVTKTNEQAFYDTLKTFFVGPTIEGQGGFVKLSKARQTYYQKLVTALQQEIEKHNNLKENIYGLLNEFLIFSTRQHSFWDIQKWFYYVKTDVIFQSMSIEADGFTFFFDVSQASYKKNNEKRNIVYELREVKDNAITFLVYYKEGNLTTNITSILDAIGDKITESELKKVFKKYERKIKQTERDFFIHKDVRNFLREKLKLWVGEYVYNNELTQDTIIKFQTAKEIIHKLINLIGAFEDTVLQLWNTPRAAINTNYVITLDRIAIHGDKGIKIIEQILNHQGIQAQTEEWKSLGIISDGFSVKDIKANFEKYKFLPIDTKYFKDLEIEILGLFDDLDNALDGWLIKSENYQALNTLLPKFKEKVQTIYIDPPFNLESSDQFLYRTNYKDSTWATLLENRLRLAKDWLNEKGSIFVRCDYNGNWIVRCVMDEIFGKENFRNEIVVKRGEVPRGEVNRLLTGTDYLQYYSKTERNIFKTPKIQRETRKWLAMHLPGERTKYELQVREFFGKKLLPPKGRHWALSQEEINKLISEERIRINEKKKYTDTQGNLVEGMPEILQSEEIKLNSNWTDIPSYSIPSKWGFPTENSEILLKRVIESTSNEGDLVMDFFLGSGTTTAVAHKLKRKWIGVEMGEHFYTVILPRMKKVLVYDKLGISKQVPQYKGGGFFVYFELEQFDDVLNKFSL